MIKTSKLLVFALAIMLFTPTAIFAYEAKSSTSVFVDKNESIDGTLYAAGQNVTIEGNITGDLICGAQTVLVNGNVDGDIICGAQSIIINGDVNGNIRLAAESILINGKVSRNANLFGASISVGPEALIERDLFLAAAISNISGKINNSLHGIASYMNLNAEIGKDVKLRIADSEYMKSPKSADNAIGLRVGDETIINGNLYYTAMNEGQIENGATIKGEKGFSKTKVKTNQNSGFLFFWNSIYKIFAALMVGLVLISFFRKPVTNIIGDMKNNAGGAIGRGAVIMFVTPFVIIILIFTLIGIPLAVFTFFAWLLSFYLAKILFGIFIGQELIKSLDHKVSETGKNPSIIYSMIIGVSIVQLFSSIEIIGWIFGLIAIWWGLGGMWLYSKKLASNS